MSETTNPHEVLSDNPPRKCSEEKGTRKFRWDICWKCDCAMKFEIFAMLISYEMFGKADSNEVEEVSGGGRLGMFSDFTRVAGVLPPQRNCVERSPLLGTRLVVIPSFLRIAMCYSVTPRHLCEMIHTVKKGYCAMQIEMWKTREPNQRRSISAWEILLNPYNNVRATWTFSTWATRLHTILINWIRSTVCRGSLPLLCTT